MSGGGGGNQGVTEYKWNPALEGPWTGAVNRAIWESERQFTPYMGGDPTARIAGLDSLHNKAAGNMENFTDALISPHNAMNAGTNQLEQTLSGQYLNGAGVNPYASQRNQFSGVDNPFFADVLQQGNDSIISNYSNAVSPEITRLFNMSGAFGGSAHTKAMSDAQANLGKTLQNYNAGMQNDQYNRSAGLEENYLGRGASAYDAERNRMMGAVSGAQNEQNNVMQRLQGLMSMGDMRRSLNQDHLNINYENYLGDLNENRYGLDFLTGIMSRAQGGMSNVHQTAPSYQVSPYSALMGGLMAYGAMR